MGIVSDIRRLCLVCQACDPPNFSMRRPISMTPIPDRFMAHVCLDVKYMPRVTYDGQNYDAILLCVDRHSGWVIARPTQIDGLTGDLAAKILLDGSWGEVGIPSVITSDQGVQFKNDFWATLCSRLGIRQAFSQSYRAQSNGRAEVAGRVLVDILRKLLIDQNISWVEALPRALRILHDLRDPVLDVSPYELVFGRQRALAGLPWTTPRECPDAAEFLEHMRQVDANLARLLNAAHEKVARRVNAHRKEGPDFQVGDWVWYARPREVGGMKLKTWWMGPYKIWSQVGDRSFQLRSAQGEMLDAHVDQLKPCVWEELEEPEADMHHPPKP